MPTDATAAGLVLEVVGLRVQRSGAVVLDEISWTVRRGERWVIMGANGSGKTSLLSSLTGVLTPTAGRICLLGQEYGKANWQTLRRAIGVVGSSIRQMVNDDETGMEVLASGLYGQINHWGRLKTADIAAARQMSKMLGSAQVLDRPWAVLSQGERQRTLIGRALLGNPRLLILDEPCAGLDPAARSQFLHFVTDFVTRSGAPPVIFVTHHVEEITPAFTHVLGLRQGRVLFAGETKTTLTSKSLSELFGSAIHLTFQNGEYHLHSSTRRGRLT